MNTDVLLVGGPRHGHVVGGVNSSKIESPMVEGGGLVTYTRVNWRSPRTGQLYRIAAHGWWDDNMAADAIVEADFLPVTGYVD